MIDRRKFEEAPRFAIVVPARRDPVDRVYAYEPQRMSPMPARIALPRETEPRYGVNAPTWTVPIKIALTLSYSRIGRPTPGYEGLPPRFAIRSRLRPVVGCNDLDWLVSELARLDAQNISRDHVFDGRELLVKAAYAKLPYDFFDYYRRQHRDAPVQRTRRLPTHALYLESIAVRV